MSYSFQYENKKEEEALPLPLGRPHLLVVRSGRTNHMSGRVIEERGKGSEETEGGGQQSQEYLSFKWGDEKCCSVVLGFGLGRGAAA